MEELCIAPPRRARKVRINRIQFPKHRAAELHAALEELGVDNPVGRGLEIVRRRGGRGEHEVVEAQPDFDVGCCAELVEGVEELDVRCGERGAADVGETLEEDDCSESEPKKVGVS